MDAVSIVALVVGAVGLVGGIGATYEAECICGSPTLRVRPSGILRPRRVGGCRAGHRLQLEMIRKYTSL